MDTVVLDERKSYRKLDFSKIKFADKPMPSEKSLKDIISIGWADDILNGKKKVVVKRQK